MHVQVHEVLTQREGESPAGLGEDLGQRPRVLAASFQQQQPTERRLDRKRRRWGRSQDRKCLYLWKNALMHCSAASCTFHVLSFSFSHIRLQSSCWKHAAGDTLALAAS